MKITLDLKKSIHSNAAAQYDRAKKLRAKAQGALKAAEETRRKLAQVKPLPARKMRVKEEQAPKEWFEKFRFFTTSGGFLALAGRDAKQNDLLYSRHLQEGDLFFHADIQGAPAVILKNGEKAGEKDLNETAQFAACFSSAWKKGFQNIDVYAVPAKSVDKRASGEFLAKGAFMIHGERRWFRNTALRLKVKAEEGGILAVPALCGGSGVELMPGATEKKRMASALEKTLGVAGDFAQLLPQGSFERA